MKSRLFYISLNLIIPGLGQLAMKAWTRAVIMIAGTIAALIWFFFEVLMQLLPLYRDDFSGDINIDVKYILLSLGLILVMYLWSIADAAWCHIETPKEEKEEKGQ